MFGSEILDVLIGLALVFLLLSLIASAVREALEAMFRTRAVYLERGIRELLDSREKRARDLKWSTPDPTAKSQTDLATALYDHPAISALYQNDYKPAVTQWERVKRWFGWHNLPAYIPADSFVTALLDIAIRGPRVLPANSLTTDGPRITLSRLRQSVPNLGNDRVGRAILAAIDLADGDMTQARANIANWFNSSMDRVSGWYKRWTQLYLFAIGFIVAILLNVNTITVARYLYRDKGTREAIARIADGVSRDQTAVQKEQVETLVGRMEALNLPIGWRYGLAGVRPGDDSAKLGFVSQYATDDDSSFFWRALRFALLGWVMTGLAVSLGAPFWFDLLNKFMVIRSTVKPHEKSPEEGSEDRPDKTPPAGGTGGQPARRAGGDPELAPGATELLKRLSREQKPTTAIPDLSR